MPLGRDPGVRPGLARGGLQAGAHGDSVNRLSRVP